MAVMQATVHRPGLENVLGLFGLKLNENRRPGGKAWLHRRAARLLNVVNERSIVHVVEFVNSKSANSPIVC